MTSFVLDSFYVPADKPENARLELRLTNTGSTPLKSFSLAFTSLTRARADAVLENATGFRRVANFHEVSPPENLELTPGGSWNFAFKGLANEARHRLDGPKSGYVTTNGAIADVQCTDLRAPTALITGERKIVSGGSDQEQLHLTPWPQSVEIDSYRDDLSGYALENATPADLAAAAKINALSNRLFPDTPYPFRFQSLPEFLKLDFRLDNTLSDDGYQLDWSSDAVTLSYGAATGRDYGLTTLAQIASGAYRVPGSFRFPANGRIKDEPRFSWRGTHLDVSRHFRGPEDIRRLLDILAWGRMNVFQWHLTDDEGWRIEIKAYPELTSSGSKRGPGSLQVAQLGFASETYAGFYSQEDIQKIVAHAASLNIDVLPEIDIPGHCTAVLTTYPKLADQAEPPESYHSIQGYPNNALNPAMSTTYEFLEKVFAEIAHLFPFDFIHIGGDEVDTKSWLTSPKVQRLMEEQQLQDTMEVQAYFMEKVRTILTKLGKKLAGWDEVSHGGGIDPDGVLLMAWQKQEVTKNLIDEGYEVICTPGQNYYMDMVQASCWMEPGASWAGVSRPEATYAYEPSDGISQERQGLLRGVQACIWCEHMTSNEIFNHMVFPRLYAVAEAGWTLPENKNWQRFAGQSVLFPEL
ncbi:MAG: beta-N-acetylhexosaminidase [Roseibium sp.]|uniref:beta-N-acetylhexosaminidase n=1 Tax=Roseibium sp. TaxID=1936156 RepID=UPI002622460B|nr:beta-N-acetylhexosaminidase [Roseibium sp.]MCV0429263.1 beta-N-acetylhexosaminidase [Roseibium sp.]